MHTYHRTPSNPTACLTLYTIYTRVKSLTLTILRKWPPKVTTPKVGAGVTNTITPYKRYRCDMIEMYHLNLTSPAANPHLPKPKRPNLSLTRWVLQGTLWVLRDIVPQEILVDLCDVVPVCLIIYMNTIYIYTYVPFLHAIEIVNENHVTT